MRTPPTAEQLRLAHGEILSGLRKVHAENVSFRHARRVMLSSRNLSDTKRKEYEADLALTDVVEHELNRVIDVVERFKREATFQPTDAKSQAPSGQEPPAGQ